MDSPRLLLVEDEPALADLLKKYLERLGYTVDACAQADAALALLDAHPEDYALLITDLSLPDMSGDELMTRSRLRAAHLRAIIAKRLPLRAPRRGCRVSAETFLAQPAGAGRRAGTQSA
jgi:CheY-like chemotaxis protein